MGQQLGRAGVTSDSGARRVVRASVASRLDLHRIPLWVRISIPDVHLQAAPVAPTPSYFWSWVSNKERGKRSLQNAMAQILVCG